MTETAFTYTVRMLVCPNCGAPVRAPLAGGEIECTDCHVFSLCDVRRETPERIRHTVDAAPADPVDETTRHTARLRAQRADVTRVSPYDISRIPAGLERYASGSLDGKLDNVTSASVPVRRGDTAVIVSVPLLAR